MTSSSLGSTAFRSVLAVVAGYVALALLTIPMTWTLAQFLGLELDRATGVPAERPPASYSLLNLVGSAVVATIAGAITARLAPRSAMTHVWILGGLVFVLGMAYQALQLFRGLEDGAVTEQAWYLLLLPAVGLLGIAVGGALITRTRKESPASGSS